MTKTTVVAETKTNTRPAWDLDVAHSSADFSVRHMMIASVRGTIPIKRATVEFDPADLDATRIEAELDVAQVNTGADQRDGHLKSADFFDVAQHPTLLFRAQGAEDTGEGYRIRGDLTIRGVTRPVTLETEPVAYANDPWGNHRAGISATTTFDRRDFGLTWNQAIEAGGVLVGDKVKVRLDLQFVQRK